MAAVTGALFAAGRPAPAGPGAFLRGTAPCPRPVRSGRRSLGAVTDFPDVRLHVVTGKGGTGKTTVAAALALALASGGRRVLLCEVEGRQGIAQLFDSPPLPYEERKVAVAPGGGDVYALAIDPEEALLDYLQMFYRLSPTGIPARTLRRIGAIDFATTVAPGLRDVLLTGKVKEAVVRSGRTGPAYDAVVLDAPPTGRIARFLNITHEVGGLAKVGPLKQPVRRRDGGAALARDRRAPGDAAGGDARAGDDRRGRRARGDRPAGRRRRRQRRPRAAARAGRPRRRRGGRAGPRRRSRRGCPAPGCRSATGSSPALAGEAAEHAVRVALEERGRDALAGLERPTLRAAAARGHGRPRRAVRARRGCSRRRGWHDAHRCSTSTRCWTPRGSWSAAAPAASARRRPPPRWRCARPSAGGAPSCSPSTRPAGWRSRWG